MLINLLLVIPVNAITFGLVVIKVLLIIKRKYSLAKIDNNQLAAIARRRECIGEYNFAAIAKARKSYYSQFSSYGEWITR